MKVSLLMVLLLLCPMAFAQDDDAAGRLPWASEKADEKAGKPADTSASADETQCTAGEALYQSTIIRTNESQTRAMKRAAIMRALGSPTTNPNYVQRSLNAQWFFERESEAAVFAGYNVRGHYLGVAVRYHPQGLETIICDSANLKQTETSIHKKAGTWKDDLNAALRVELGVVATDQGRIRAYLEQLRSLQEAGFISDRESAVISTRIEESASPAVATSQDK